MADVTNEIMTNDKTKILSGEFLNFYTPRRQRIRSFKVYFSPKQEGSGTPSPENVRPISGWTGVEVQHCGKNLLNESEWSKISNLTYENGIFSTTQRVPFSYIYFLRTFKDGKRVQNLQFSKNTELNRYVCSVPIVLGNIDTIQLGFLNTESNHYLEYDASKIFPTDGDYFISFKLNQAYTSSQIGKMSELQIELGSEATEYTPYKTNLSSENRPQYIVDWSSIGTIYGGYVDLVSGELVETWKNFTVDGTESSYAQNSYQRFTVSIDPENKNLLYERTKNDHLLCDKLLNTGANGMESPEYRVAVLSNQSLQIKITADINTPELFREWLVNNPLQVAVELAEPITHQLSSTTMSTLMWDNNFWSNADRIEIEYDYIGIFDAIESRKNIFTATPHLETLSGMNMTFNTDMERELKKCIINFSPIQLGTGDPSPENVRNIYGRSEIGIGLSNENLLSKDPPTEKIYNRTTGGSGGTWAGASNTKVCAIIPMPYGATIFLQKNSTGHSANVNLGRNTVINVGDRYYQNSGFTNDVDIAKTAANALEYYVNFYSVRINTFNASWTDYGLMISYGATRKTYVPPMGTILNIDFPETIYGGYVDLLNGELVKTWDTYLGSDLTWTIYTDFSGGYVFRATNFTGKLLTADINYYCNSYTPIRSWGLLVDAPDKTCRGNPSSQYKNYFYVKDSDYANNLEGFIEHIANARFVYELETPVHYTIEPQTLKTLQGVNNIWSNANGNIEIAYWKHGDDSYQHVPSSPITSNDNFIIVTDDGYAIGEEDDFIVY